MNKLFHYVYFSKTDQLTALLEMKKDISSTLIFAYGNYVVKEAEQGWLSDFTMKAQNWFESS